MDIFNPDNKMHAGRHLGYVETIIDRLDLAYLVDNSHEVRAMIRPSKFVRDYLKRNQCVEFMINEHGEVIEVKVI